MVWLSLVRGAGHEALVHQQADTLAHRQGDGGSDHQGQQGQQHLPAIGADELPGQAQGAALTWGNRFGHGDDHNAGEAADYHSSRLWERLQVAIAHRSNQSLELSPGFCWTVAAVIQKLSQASHGAGLT